jgi:hypothetical protein
MPLRFNKSLPMTLAALPQHRAGRLCLTVQRTQLYLRRGLASPQKVKK